MKLSFYRFIPVITLPKLLWGTGGAFVFFILTLDRSKRHINDKEYEAHLEHEFTHIKQQWLFLIIPWVMIYLYDLFRHGYRSEKHRFENQARVAERKHLAKLRRQYP